MLNHIFIICTYLPEEKISIHILEMWGTKKSNNFYLRTLANSLLVMELITLKQCKDRKSNTCWNK